MNSSTSLYHSVNSSGRMGLYVDSFHCPCQGCLQVKDAVDAGQFATPEYTASPALLSPVALTRAPANHIPDGEGGWVAQDSVAALSILSAIGQAAIDERAADTSSSLPTTENVDDLMERLRSLRADLQIAQDKLYSPARSHDEMAMADMEFDDYEQKIHAIENCMLAFGAIFRTR